MPLAPLSGLPLWFPWRECVHFLLGSPNMPCSTRCLGHIVTLPPSLLKFYSVILNDCPQMRPDALFYKSLGLRENIPWPTGKRGDTGRFPFTKRFRKIPETSVGNVYWCFTQSSHSFPDFLHRPMYLPAKYKMAAQLLLSNEKLELDDAFFPIMGAVATHMRCDLHRNQGF